MSKNVRPHMVIFKRFVPSAGVDTRRAGWAATGTGLESVERYEIVDRISKRHNRDGVVIIDLLDMKLIKNGTGLDNDKTLNYYAVRYAQDMGSAIEQWLMKAAIERKAAVDAAQ
jgi:hypothetical protein